MIIGGAEDKLRKRRILREFVAASGGAEARIAVPVVGEEEQRLHGEQQHGHRDPGQQPRVQRVGHDPRPRPGPPVAALVRVVAD